MKEIATTSGAWVAISSGSSTLQVTPPPSPIGPLLLRASPMTSAHRPVSASTSASCACAATMSESPIASTRRHSSPGTPVIAG
jgi:hypothetical protein